MGMACWWKEVICVAIQARTSWEGIYTFDQFIKSVYPFLLTDHKQKDRQIHKLVIGHTLKIDLNWLIEFSAGCASWIHEEMNTDMNMMKKHKIQTNSLNGLLL